MKRACDVCGVTYEAQRTNSKYCTPNCRQRKARGWKPPDGAARVVALSNMPDLPAEPGVGPVEATTLGMLAEAERENTPLGQAALALARRVDSPREMGAGLAALVKQLEQTLRSATSGVHEDASPLDKARDDLAARREARGA